MSTIPSFTKTHRSKRGGVRRNRNKEKWVEEIPYIPPSQQYLEGRNTVRFNEMLTEKALALQGEKRANNGEFVDSEPPYFGFFPNWDLASHIQCVVLKSIVDRGLLVEAINVVTARVLRVCLELLMQNAENAYLVSLIVAVFDTECHMVSPPIEMAVQTNGFVKRFPVIYDEWRFLKREFWTDQIPAPDDPLRKRRGGPIHRNDLRVIIPWPMIYGISEGLASWLGADAKYGVIANVNGTLEALGFAERLVAHQTTMEAATPAEKKEWAEALRRCPQKYHEDDPFLSAPGYLLRPELHGITVLRLEVPIASSAT